MKQIDNLNDIHNILFKSLCYFDDFCRKNNIKYFLSNGTLLGAAKYQEFVPWDDDIDVLVPREDYDRLVRAVDINCDRYRLLCREQNPNWRMPYAKLSCNDTLIKEGEYDFGAEFGLSVDVFPIDKWSTNLFVAKLQAFRSECLKRLLVCSIGGPFASEKRGWKRLILKSIWISGKSLGPARIYNLILRTIEHSRNRVSKYVGCLSWTCHLDKEIFPADYFEKTSYLTFCGRAFPVIEQYGHYLDSLYGNWRAELPPEKQRSNHDIKVWWKNAK